MTRHTWRKLAVHRYVCQRCGLEKHNLAELQPGGQSAWRVEFRRGENVIATGHTPPCPGAVPAMTWAPVPNERYAYDSPETGYRISLSRVMGKPVYTAWTPGRVWLANYPTAAGAREACWTHHQLVSTLKVKQDASSEE